MDGAVSGGAAASAQFTAGGAGTAAGGVFSLLGLVLATLGILVLAWWASRWVGLHGVPAVQGGEGFRVLGQLPLGRNERLVLVRFQDRCLLLGVTNYAVTLLRDLDAEESAAWMAEAKEPSGFGEVLGGFLRSRQSGGAGPSGLDGDGVPKGRQSGGNGPSPEEDYVPEERRNSGKGLSGFADVFGGMLKGRRDSGDGRNRADRRNP